MRNDPDGRRTAGINIPQSWLVAAVVAASLLRASCVRAATVPPDYFGAKPGSLATAKARIAVGDKDAARALKNLLEDAAEALRETPPTVTAKAKLPPSGDRHDYMSVAPYFWPDPKSKTGLPYIRHDGKVNPESRDEHANDSVRIRLMGGSVETLALAYYFTGDEKYAAQAARFLRVWFLDPATRMNPNFRFAQAVPGENDGRGTGILEARHIAVAADAVRLLAGSKSWAAADQLALNAWLEKYFDWLLNSDAGKDECAARNNHGTWYDVQAAELALCLGRNDVARRIIETAKTRRVAVQIEPDGRQALELVRTTSFSYSRFNLEALCALATLGEHAGVDLWHYQTADGRSLRRAVEFMLPFVDSPPKPWPYEQIKDKHDRAEFMLILWQSALALNTPECQAVLAKQPAMRGKRFQLMFSRAILPSETIDASTR